MSEHNDENQNGEVPHVPEVKLTVDEDGLTTIDSGDLVTDSQEAASIAPAADKEYPVVDPTGTYSDWADLDSKNLIDPEGTLKHKDFIPVPKVNKDGDLELHPNPNVKVGLPVTSNKDPVPGLMPLYTFQGNNLEMFNLLTKYDLVNARGQRRKSITDNDEHAFAIGYSHDTTVNDDYLHRAQWRPGATWTNLPNIDGKDCQAGKAHSLIGGVGERISAQLQKSAKRSRLGNAMSFPLWHTGVWVTVDTPTATQRVEFDLTIASERNVFGRKTIGALFSNSRAYIDNALLDLFFDCLESVNVRDWGTEWFRKVIDPRDLQLIAAMLGASRYPTGYPTLDPCTNPVLQCKAVNEKGINLANTIFVDLSRFTRDEKAHMQHRNAIHTMKTVEAYQENARWNATSIIEIDEDTSVRIKIPRLVDNIDSGLVWANEINQIVTRLLGDSSPTRDRTVAVERMINSAALRSHVAYIDDILIGGVPTHANDMDKLKLITRVGDDSDIIERFSADIRTMMEEEVIAMMAFPRYLCPKCRTSMTKEQQNAYAANPILIPQDAVSRFFQLRSLG